MYTKFWSENLKGRDHLEDVGIGGEILKWMLGKMGSGFIWLRIGTSDGLV